MDFYQQTDGCTTGGPLSVMFANIFKMKMEEDVVSHLQPAFYRRFRGRLNQPNGK